MDWTRICLAFCMLFVASAWGGSSDRVKLKDVEVLTLRQGQFTNGRRSAGVPQIRCVGGTAGCSAFAPQVVQCYNRGFDGNDFQWECKTDMDNAYRFGAISVSCEGYDYPDDPYILRDSCGLEYTIDLTQEGYDQKRNQQQGSSYDAFTSQKKGESSLLETLCIYGGVAIVVYAVYKTCIAPPNHRAEDQRSFSSTNDDYPGRPGGSPRAPPPPGFRSDYYSSGGAGSDSCGAGAGSSSSSSGAGNAGGGGGFWSGAATGGLLGYMFGSRNARDSAYYSTGTGYVPRSSGYDSWGTRSRGSSSYSNPGPSSSGTRSASGFGGTTRR